MNNNEMSQNNAAYQVAVEIAQSQTTEAISNRPFMMSQEVLLEILLLIIDQVVNQHVTIDY